jgi:pyrroline-5-carboxylate reductase
LISVKPQDISELLDSVKLYFDSGKNVIICIAAGIPTAFVESKIGGKPPVVRIMPNAPAMVKRCMSAISSGKYVSRQSLDFTIDLIKNLGDYVLIDESLQNIATALSGSGPAYFFLICKYLIESGIIEGLERETAEKLVVNTMIGAGEMMKQCGNDADQLIKMVASPGGTTERALNKFYDENLKTILALAVESAKNRADELLDSLNN